MPTPLKILILEDSNSDAELIQRLLKKEMEDCLFNLAMDKKSFLQSLEEFSPDVILSDNSLPQFDSSEALKIVQQKMPDIPFILVTGTVSEEFAANIIKSGADDYILKDRMKRLPAAIEAALKQRRTESERKEKEDNVKSLEKILLEQRIQEQKKITRAVIIAQDMERSHMGQELHDNINQILAAAKIYLSVAGDGNEEIKELIKYPLKLIEDSIQEIRILCQKLVTPIKNINLQALIIELLNMLSQRTKVKTSLSYVVSKDFVSDDIKLTMYRILQEQVSNILKYALAENVSISIKTTDKVIHLAVADDGKGFDVGKHRTGIGISNMINRVESFNGKIDIESSLGKGCLIKISIPY